MLNKLLLIITIPILIATFFFFDGNIMSYLGFPIDSVRDIANQFAGVTTAICTMFDIILVDGVMLIIFKLWFLWSFANIIYKLIQKIFNLAQ